MWADTWCLLFLQFAFFSSIQQLQAEHLINLDFTLNTLFFVSLMFSDVPLDFSHVKYIQPQRRFGTNDLDANLCCSLKSLLFYTVWLKKETTEQVNLLGLWDSTQPSLAQNINTCVLFSKAWLKTFAPDFNWNHFQRSKHINVFSSHKFTFPMQSTL